MEYYVDQKATPSGNGSKEAPFQHISQAASVAVPGDVIYVLPGIYREWVDPQNGGTPDQRITYFQRTVESCDYRRRTYFRMGTV